MTLLHLSRTQKLESPAELGQVNLMCYLKKFVKRTLQTSSHQIKHIKIYFKRAANLEHKNYSSESSSSRGTPGCTSPSANPTSASFQMRIRAFPKMEVLGRGPAAAEANACGNGGRPGKEQPGPDQLHGRGMRKANDDRAFFSVEKP